MPAQNNLNLPKSLGDGLVLRLAWPDDVEAVAALNERVLIEEGEPPGIFSAWTRDLFSPNHPEAKNVIFVVVEDTVAGQIVSSTGLIPQVWRYDDLAIPVGRPEMVVTAKAYRRRGLTRAIFETIHALSTAQGHLAQGITGIPWFYRQFGYEYALPLGGSRDLSVHHIPPLKEGETEPYLVRRAGAADAPLIRPLYERQVAGRLVTAELDEARWAYDISGISPDSAQSLHVYCLTDRAGQVVGYFTMSGHFWDERSHLFELVTGEGLSLHAVLPSVLRALKAQGEQLAAVAKPEPGQLNFLRFSLGEGHPLYDLLAAKLSTGRPPYAWYVRVPDLPRLVRHLRPVLEKRLAASPLHGYSGELKLSFYRDGLRLAFEAGQLTEVAVWPPPDTDHHEWQGAGFPPLVFLQLLFGYRSLDELRYAFPDCWADEEPELLLQALFPKQPSWVLPLG